MKCSNKALDYIKDTTIWLAGMQTTMLAAIGILAQAQLSFHIRSVIIAVVYLVLSLFCAAWLLTGLPSMSLRVGMSKPLEVNDILSQPIYSWLPNVMNFEYFLTLIHWYWAIAIVAFGYTLIKAIQFKSKN